MMVFLLALILVSAQLPPCYSIDSPDAPLDTEISEVPYTNPFDPEGIPPVQSQSAWAMPAFAPSYQPDPYYQMEPVIFSAVRASDHTRRSTTKINFDNTITDIGYGWYPSRNEFICYYPGTYFFTFSTLTAPNSHLKVSLMRNGYEVVSTWGEKSGYQAGSNSVILQLNKNERVYLNIQEGSLHETGVRGRGYTTFSGFRLN